MRRRGCLALLCALLLAACASLPDGRSDCVALGGGGGLCLLPPASLPTMRVTHMVTLSHADHHENFIGQLQINRDELRLAALSLFGNALFTVTWDGKVVSGSAADERLDPAMLVAMLELALADPARLRPQLHGFSLTVQGPPGQRVRELRRWGKLAVRIEQTGADPNRATLDIHIPRAGLSLHLEPL